MTEDDKRARNRFVVLNLVRLAGLVLVLTGIAIRFGKLDAPQWAAVALVVAGLGSYFWGPNFVARNWRTPDE